MYYKTKLILIFLLTILACEGNKSSEPQPTSPLVPLPPPVDPGTCDTGVTTSFQEIKPLLDKYGCIGCHSNQGNYVTWTNDSWADSALRRMQLGENDTKRMPPPPRAQISNSDLDIFKKFYADGKPEVSTCRPFAYHSKPLMIVDRRVHGPSDLLRYRILFNTMGVTQGDML